MRDARPRVAVIGGGFTGLAAATTLRHQSDAEIHIFEKLPRLGGLASGFREPGWTSSLELFYHHWFTSDRFVAKFTGDWGLDSNVFFRELLTVVETEKGRFVPLDSAMSLLKHPELSWVAKFRMGFALAYLKTTKAWRKLEREPAERWCRRWMGDEGFEAIWQPLLEGKFGVGFAREVNMAWLWARIATRTKKLGSYQGGFLKLAEDAGAVLAKRGVVFHVGCGDVSIQAASGGRYSVSGSGSVSAPEDFDAVLVAASPFALQQIAGPLLDSKWMNDVRSQPALGVQNIILSLKQPLNPDPPFYWYSLRKSADQPFLAVIEHTHFVPPSEFGGQRLVYVARYEDTNSAAWRDTDEAILGLALRTCRRINPKFQDSWVSWNRVFRESYAQPIMRVDASKRVPPLRVPGCKGFYFASLAHVYPWDRGTNFALELGEKAAGAIMEDLR